MVTVEATEPYKDLDKKLLFYKGERHEVTEDRAKALIAKGVVKLVKQPKEKTETV